LSQHGGRAWALPVAVSQMETAMDNLGQFLWIWLIGAPLVAAILDRMSLGRVPHNEYTAPRETMRSATARA
jgi:hypothetical protein